jgi:hypothetical protein
MQGTARTAIHQLLALRIRAQFEHFLASRSSAERLANRAQMRMRPAYITRFLTPKFSCKNVRGAREFPTCGQWTPQRQA